MNTKIGSFSVL